MSVTSYTEAKRVQKTVRELERKEQGHYNKVRNEKIEVQLNHICSKHEQEVLVLDKKLNTSLMEVDKVRKRDQAALLQKFLNIQNQLHINQRLEKTKLHKVLKVKNYASTIVGKMDGCMKSFEYAL